MSRMRTDLPDRAGARSGGVSPRAILRLVLSLALLACRDQSVPPLAAPEGFLRRPSPEHVRVMSFNVHWDSIFPGSAPRSGRRAGPDRPNQFVRMLKAVDPDVVCLQEIDPERDPRQVGQILDRALPLPGGKRWRVHAREDNVIASRFDLAQRAGGVVGGREQRGAGHAKALVDLPDRDYPRDLYLFCAHFKAHGDAESIAVRQRQADLVVQTIRDLQTRGGTYDLPRGTPILIVGDLNVYETDPARHLGTLLKGDIADEARYGADTPPDWDATPLADALPRHNASGDRIYTWRNDASGFKPGALDRILYTDSVLTVGHTFVLDTTMMTEADLSAAGLRKGDVLLDPANGSYDHFPLVVDVRPRVAASAP